MAFFQKEIVRRYLFFLVGLFINSLGVSFITKADLGTSPISSIPYTLSLGFKPTLGMFTLYMSLVLIAIQLLLLRKKFPKQYFCQIPVALLFSYFIDLTMQLLSFMEPERYPTKLIFLLIGCMILGVGVFMEMVANVVMLPGESFVNAVSITFHTDFGKTKVAFDTSMTVVAAVLGIILYHRLAGVREGTVIAAILVGLIARQLKRRFGKIEKIFYGKGTRPVSKEAELPLEQPVVITIAREYGSCGRKIARQLAKEMGFDFYDREIIRKAANTMDLDETIVAQKEQKMTNSFLYDMVAQFYNFSEQKVALDQLYEAEQKAILDLAAKGNCVIVGRCADHICRNMDNVYHVFLYADNETKIREIAKREQMTREQAQAHMETINQQRYKHYKYYTGQVMGLAKNYDLCVDTGQNGPQATVAIIKEAVRSFEQAREHQPAEEQSA